MAKPANPNSLKRRPQEELNVRMVIKCKDQNTAVAYRPKLIKFMKTNERPNLKNRQRIQT